MYKNDLALNNLQWLICHKRLLFVKISINLRSQTNFHGIEYIYLVYIYLFIIIIIIII